MNANIICSAYQPHRSAIVKAGIYKYFSGTGQTMYSWDEVRGELHYVNWIKILLISERESDFSRHFTPAVMSQMQGLNAMGILGEVFGKIDPGSFLSFNAQGVGRLTVDQVGNMTAGQWNSIPLTSLDRNVYGKTVFIPAEVIPQISPQHLAALARYIYEETEWRCQQLLAITPHQLTVFSYSLAVDYNTSLVSAELGSRYVTHHS